MTVGNVCIEWVASKVMICPIHGLLAYSVDLSSMLDELSRSYLLPWVCLLMESSMVVSFYPSTAADQKGSICILLWERDQAMPDSTMLVSIGKHFLTILTEDYSSKVSNISSVFIDDN